MVCHFSEVPVQKKVGKHLNVEILHDQFLSEIQSGRLTSRLCL